MDQQITDQSTKQGLNLDFELLKNEFENNPDGAADNHVIETLFTILDFHKFKHLMLAYKDKENYVVELDSTTNHYPDLDNTHHQLIEDGIALLGTKDSDIWKLHTKVGINRECYQSKDIKSIQPLLKVIKLKNSVWKIDIIMKDINYNKINRF